MLNYEDLLAELEASWAAVGLHEHDFVESFLPATHDRMCKVELFPPHDEPMIFENTPPWVELNYTWMASHQLESEGREVVHDPLELNWIYTVNVRGSHDRSDSELVRIVQQAFQRGFQRFYPLEALEMEPVAVDVRRTYQTENGKVRLAYIQLVTSNITDLSTFWAERDPTSLRTFLRIELQLAAAIISLLSDAFLPPSSRGSGGSYKSVDAA